MQIGDPFTGKKLIECTLALLDAGLVVSLQDLGAAGLASSTAEMASSGGVGLDVDLSRVPLREAGMEPFEIMISESQERMAAIVTPERWPEVEALCAHWDIDATVIGEVTDRGRLRAFHDGTEVGDIPVSALVEDCPRLPALAGAAGAAARPCRSILRPRRRMPPRPADTARLTQHRQPPLDHPAV